jgi:hypothetical protein
VNTYPHLPTPRTYRRVSAAAIGNFATTAAQAARLAAFGETHGKPAVFWDDRLLDRLSSPLSRIRE